MDHPAGGALTDRTVEQSGRCRNRQEHLNAMRPGTFTEDGDTARVSSEGRYVLAHPLQCQYQIAEVQIAVDGVPRIRQGRQVHCPVGSDAIVHGDEDTSATREVRSVVQGQSRTAQNVGATMDIEHHRQRIG
ncbi:Uncharacterised protein [Mycobacteroides abscessus subsp. abscessus]|nr:Uncharacterised protein [Mycobacteroides abscessus subsp. abscessus]